MSELSDMEAGILSNNHVLYDCSVITNRSLEYHPKFQDLERRLRELESKQLDTILAGNSNFADVKEVIVSISNKINELISYISHQNRT